MIIASLDEGGRFEFDSRSASYINCMLIGGSVFSCRTEDDAKNERRRLQKLFKETCAVANCSYPADLHINRDVSGSVINGDRAGAVKKALAMQLPDFLRGTGAWANDRPRGTYSLYCMVGDKEGMGSVKGGNLADDNMAALRYEHMVYRTVENLIFFNPALSVDTEIRLELATRIVSANGIDNVAKDLGYANRRSDNGIDKTKFVVTDEGSFRAAIEAAVENNSDRDLDFRLMVQSINYNSEQFHQMFLYLADTLCSVYQDAVVGCTKCGSALTSLLNVCSGLVGESNVYLWAYNPIDRLYREISRNIRYGAYFDALFEINSLRLKPTDLSRVYDRLWFTRLERRAQSGRDNILLNAALDKLNTYIAGKDRNLSIGESIYKTLELQHRGMEKSRLHDRLQYTLYKVRMALDNHHGDYEKALESYNKCVEYSSYTDIEEFLGVQLLRCVSLLDRGDTDGALDLAKEMVGHHELLNEIKDSIHDVGSVRVSYGRALSQLGQCYANCGDYDNAASSFKKALDRFGGEASDRGRTLSYLLHALIEAGDREAFISLAPEYIGTGDIAADFKKTKKLPDGIHPFALYIYMKALYLFWPDALNKKEALSLTAAVRKKYTAAPDSHPWELIFRYCALLLTVCGAPDEAEEFIDFASDSVRNETDGKLIQIIEDGKNLFEAAKHGDRTLSACRLTYMYR